MIEVRNISKSYNKEGFALEDVSFKLEKSTMTAIVGPSGCGKTTLLKILAGFLEPDGGKIFFDGADVTSLPIQKRGAAMVFQNYALWPHMTVFDNIAYGLKLKKMPKDEIERKVHEILDVVEIDKGIVKERHPNELSGGQQQRVALARSLVIDPQIVLLDEPLSNLDAKVRQRLRIEIREIQKRLKLTAVYVTHDQEEALSMSDNIIVMDKGRIMQTGSPENIYNFPSSDFVAEFLGNSNIVIGEAKDGRVYIDETEIRYLDKVNGKVKVIFRASDLSINSSKDDYIKFKGYVLGKMFSGGYYRYVVKVGNHQIFADAVEDINCEEVILGIQRNKLHIFPVSEHVMGNRQDGVCC